MELNHRTLTDAEMTAILGRAHRMRADALRSMGQAFGAWMKSRFATLKDALARPVQTTA